VHVEQQGIEGPATDPRKNVTEGARFNKARTPIPFLIWIIDIACHRTTLICNRHRFRRPRPDLHSSHVVCERQYM
jgi:hypothetical protein